MKKNSRIFSIIKISKIATIFLFVVILVKLTYVAISPKVDGIDLNTFKEVIDIDSSQKKLTIKDTLTNEIFTDNYDKLMIATGASSIIPPLEKSYNNLTTLKDMNDGIKLSRARCAVRTGDSRTESYFGFSGNAGGLICCETF